jgi:xanthine dehydrogenase accessory factor
MDLVVIRGGGDIGSGIAHRLFMSGYKVIVLEIEKPSSIRREVSFSEAIYRNEIIVEGIKGVFVKDYKSIKEEIEGGNIPVYIDEKGSIIEKLKPLAVVDGIIAKKNLGTSKQLAPITIGVGPGFEGGIDVDLVVESKRGHYLGKVILKGRAAENTGMPGEVMGYTEERIVRAPKSGIVKSFYKIGDKVEIGDTICQVDKERVMAQTSGILRGMIKDGLFVKEGLKIGDVDPRGIKDYAFTISDKARAIGGGVLEGIQYLRKERGI